MFTSCISVASTSITSPVVRLVIVSVGTTSVTTAPVARS